MEYADGVASISRAGSIWRRRVVQVGMYVGRGVVGAIHFIYPGRTSQQDVRPSIALGSS